MSTLGEASKRSLSPVTVRGGLLAAILAGDPCSQIEYHYKCGYVIGSRVSVTALVAVAPDRKKNQRRGGGGHAPGGGSGDVDGRCSLRGARIYVSSY
jgi:hypothetical protein